MTPSYAPPVDQLLRLGELKNHEFTRDYPALGLTAEHVPELIRMATDAELHEGPVKSAIVWAPVHAWRTLAALKAEAAVVPLLGLLNRIAQDDDDWVTAEVPMVLGELGRAALGPVTNFLGDPTRDEWARVAAADTLAELGQRHPGLQADCVARLVTQLERFASQSETLNAFLISSLLDLKAVAALPVMERAFAAGRVDESVNGDFEDAEIALGLKSERLHAPKPNRLTNWAAAFRGALPGDDGLDPDPAFEVTPMAPVAGGPKVGRNDPCPCGSGKKFKKCCGS